jgi:hypothetical protein
MKLESAAPCMPIIAALPASLARIGYTYAKCEINYAEYHGDACAVRVYAVAPGATIAEHVGTITAKFAGLRGSADAHSYVDAGPIAYASYRMCCALDAACKADARVARCRARYQAAIARASY